MFFQETKLSLLYAEVLYLQVIFQSRKSFLFILRACLQDKIVLCEEVAKIFNML